MNARVEGKVALITGAARGQGRSHAVRLAAEGADVIITDLCAEIPLVAYGSPTEDDLAETARLVREQGARCYSFVSDVRDRETLQAGIDAGVAELGKLNVVVANAGVMAMESWDKTSPELWDLIISTNLTGVWNTAQLAVPHLVAGGGGSVVLISSSAGIKGSPFAGAYVASKHGVVGIMKSLATDLAQNNIRVNSVHPTGVNTPMVGAEMGPIVGTLLEGNPRVAPMMMNLLDVYFVEPEDISNAVLFLASDESRYMTSTEFVVDAGITAF